MTDDHKAILQRYLQEGRDSMLSKLDGLSEYDARRPMTPTGTNLLGTVKHLTGVELGYFGDTFGRPSPEGFEYPDDDPNADFVVPADVSRQDVIDAYKRAWAHSDATIAALPIDGPGRVPWWPEGRNEVTLHKILVHMATETHRHAGQADIVREMIDNTTGLRRPGDNMPSDDPDWWKAYYDRVEREARAAATG